MAERIVSPGVFTNEKDQSFLQRGVSEIGASIIGTTIKGPAQIPTKVNSFSEFQEIYEALVGEQTAPTAIPEPEPELLQEDLEKEIDVRMIGNLISNLNRPGK